ncbi:unnamed protein product [Ilex paraguariensis]|uniref:Lipoxygenase n=1 Tax=Ilex paraguariensis TaxID=185542 RepID=A0ABC8UZ59_9AQUA
MGHCSIPEMLGKTLEKMCGKARDEPKENNKSKVLKIKGTIKLMKKNVLDFNDVGASFLDLVYELFGKGVSLQLISAVHGDPANGLKGKLGKTAFVENWISTLTSVSAGDATVNILFEWDESMSVPGAFIIKNYHHNQFYLKTVTLQDVPGHGQIHFICNSWVYPAHRYKYDRVFFANKTYLPCNTPEPLRLYREKELVNLRGNGSGQLKKWDRVYDYAYYNDLGNPDKGKEYERPVLGGSEKFPYPRRGRTGRAPSKKDPNTESRLPLLDLDIYVPRDERFDPVKFSDFLAYAFKSIGQVLVSEISSFDTTPNEFNNFQALLKLYDDGVKLPNSQTLTKLRERIPWEMRKELLANDGGRLFKLPMPDVIKEDKSAWRTDEEFGREMLAGVNPVIIRRLQEFPPASKLDPAKYGNQTSTIKREHIEKNMNGLTVDEALENNMLFILDHHDALMPYLQVINSTTTKTYASRTLLLLQNNGTLKPLAIELSLPHPQGVQYGVTSQVFTPAEHGVEGSVWQLAKAYAAVNDSGYHQLISHWYV